MSATDLHPAAEHSPRSIFALRAITSALRGFLGWIDRRFTQALQHAALSDLDDHLLKDVGLTCEDARRARPSWFR